MLGMTHQDEKTSAEVKRTLSIDKTLEEEIAFVKKARKQENWRVQAGYLTASIKVAYEDLDRIASKVDKFKQDVGDFGEIVPRLRERLEEAIGKVEDAMAEAELVVDALQDQEREGEQTS